LTTNRAVAASVEDRRRSVLGREEMTLDGPNPMCRVLVACLTAPNRHESSRPSDTLNHTLRDICRRHDRGYGVMLGKCAAPYTWNEILVTH
jgi:hypothetical protein